MNRLVCGLYTVNSRNTARVYTSIQLFCTRSSIIFLACKKSDIAITSQFILSYSPISAIVICVLNMFQGIMNGTIDLSDDTLENLQSRQRGQGWPRSLRRCTWISCPRREDSSRSTCPRTCTHLQVCRKHLPVVALSESIQHIQIIRNIYNAYL